MQEKNLTTLEYTKVLEKLSTFAKTDLGKSYCLQLKPFREEKPLQEALCQTTEAVTMKIKKGNPPISYFTSIDLSLKKIESGSFLSMPELLNLATLLKIARELKEYSNQEVSIDGNTFPLLSNIFDSLYRNPKIEQEIFSKILDEQTIDDRASKDLYHLRKEMQRLEQEIKEKLNHFLRSPNYSNYIQENVVMVRNNRYVIPVKEEYRLQIKGFIHDVSSSGSTVFIEPISIFEWNNKRNQLNLQEKIEIEKILAQLSSYFLPIIEEIKENVLLISFLDFTFAKASYSLELDAIEPILSSEKQLFLSQARHPFLEKEKVVPITVELGKNYQVLVITGPNTGGKTVTLKTVGLLCLMGLSGLHIPAACNSRIYLFDHIFADIGDEQNIQESLSTFSSHILNIIQILKQSTSESLILVDELGSGTDPVEGSSLAISILEKFHQNQCLVMATTHYPEIKNYCLLHSGFENASCEFNVETLSPTYKLLIGIPGKSNAFVISQKLGLDSSILSRASELMSIDQISMEELLKEIYDNKIRIEKEKEEIDKNLSQIETLRKALEKDYTLVREKEKQKIEEAKAEARQILQQAKQEASLTLKEIHKLSIDSKAPQKLNHLRNQLNEKQKDLLPSNRIEKPQPSNSPLLYEPKIDDSVLVTTLNQEGTIITRPNKEGMVQVQIGSLKMKVHQSNLIPILKKRTQTFQKGKSSTTLKAQHISNEVHVIGMTVDEAIFVIDKYLDDCALASLSPVHIVHGKGTGKLREGIHTFLKKHPHVKSYRMGTFGEGEMGVTVVEIK